MTAITSYTTLLTALTAWNNRADLATLYPQFIALAEAHFNRSLRVPDMMVTSTQSVDEDTVALPADFLEAREVYTDVVLQGMDPAGLRSKYADMTGDPVGYAISGGNILLAPVPGEAVTLTLSYYAKIEALSDESETNWLIGSHPDLYLRAAKFYSLEFLRDYEAADREMAFVTATIDSINRAGNRARLPAGPLRMQPTVRE